MVLHGEAAWICLMCCNADILFCVLVLHWATTKDSRGGKKPSTSYVREAATVRTVRENSTGGGDIGMAKQTADGWVRQVSRDGIQDDRDERAEECDERGTGSGSGSGKWTEVE